jgi:hypothetical protein
VPCTLALILADPETVAVKIVAAIPLASVVSDVGVKKPVLDGDTIKFTTLFGRGVEPVIAVASTTAVVFVWTVDGLTVTVMVLPVGVSSTTVLLLHPANIIMAKHTAATLFKNELNWIRVNISAPVCLVILFIPDDY